MKHSTLNKIAFLIIAMVASSLSAATKVNASSVAKQIVAKPLPNGCVPSSIIFLSRYLAENPREAGEILVIDLKDGKAEGHALAMYSSNGKVKFFDHELGEVETKILPTTTPAIIREGIREEYLFRIGRAKEAIRKGFQAAVVNQPETAIESSRRAVEMLGKDKLASLITYTLDDKASYGVAFAFDGKIWFYSPEQGAASVPVVKGSDLGTLITQAVKVQYPAATKMGVVQPESKIAKG